MPVYKIKDNETGRVISVKGDSPPTESDMEGIFAQANAFQQEPVLKNKEPEAEFDVGGTAKGVAETALTLGSGAVGSVAAGLEGLGRVAASPFTGESLDDIVKEMDKTIQKLGYEPESEEAKAIIDSVSVPLQWIDEQTYKAGAYAQDMGAGPAVATAIKVGLDAAIGWGTASLMKKGFSGAQALRTARKHVEAVNTADRLSKDSLKTSLKVEEPKPKVVKKTAGETVLETRKSFRKTYLESVDKKTTPAERRALLKEADEAWKDYTKEHLDRAAALGPAKEKAARKAIAEAGVLRRAKPKAKKTASKLPEKPLEDVYKQPNSLKLSQQSTRPFIKDLTATVTTALDKVDPSRVLSTKTRLMEHLIESKMVARNARLEDFYALSEKMYKTKRSGNWHEAYLDQDWNRLRNLAVNENVSLPHWNKSGGSVTDALKEAQVIISEMGDEAVGVRFKGFKKEPNYMPRHIDNKRWNQLKELADADEEIKKLIGTDSKGLRAIDEASFADESMRMDAYNKLLLGGGRANVSAPSPMQTFRRKVKNPAETVLKNHYEPMHKSMKRYVDDMTEAVEIRRYLGRDLGKMDDSIGAFITEAQKYSPINNREAEILKNVLRARFNEGRMHPHRSVQNIKNIGYIATIGNVWSALTQIGDSISAMRRLGPTNVIRGVGQLASKNRATVRDIGYDDIMKEMADPGRTAKWLDTTLKYSGFKLMDRMGKNVIVNASRLKWQKMTKTPKGMEILDRQYKPLFKGDNKEYLKFVDDLAEGNLDNPNVKFVVFNELADLQPIVMMDMPVAYLKHPNGRLFYALKTWSLQQLNTLWRDTVGEYRLGRVQGKGRLAAAAPGIGNFGKFAVYNAILGTVGVDFFKQFIASMAAGEKINPEDIPDEVASGLMQTLLISKWALERRSQDYDIYQFAADTVEPAFFGTATRLMQALSKEEDKEKVQGVLKLMPFGGSAYRAVEKAKEED